MHNSALVQIGNVVFNVHFVILATQQADGSVLINLADRNEHIFYGKEALLAWNAIYTHCRLVMGGTCQPAPVA